MDQFFGRILDHLVLFWHPKFVKISRKTDQQNMNILKFNKVRKLQNVKKCTEKQRKHPARKRIGVRS